MEFDLHFLLKAFSDYNHMLDKQLANAICESTILLKFVLHINSIICTELEVQMLIRDSSTVTLQYYSK